MNTPAPLPTGLTVNMELEAAFLGSLMLHNHILPFVVGVLQPDHFADDMHRQVYALAVKMIGEGKTASPVTLKHFLGDFDTGDDGPTPAMYLAHLCAVACPPAIAKDYARSIVDLAARRMLMAVTADATAFAGAASLELSSGQIIDETVERLVMLREELAAADEPEPDTASTLDELIMDSEETLEGRPRPILATKCKDLNSRLGGGLRAGRLYVLAGRPGAGKTVVSTAISYQVASREENGGHPDGVAIFSLEIDRKETWSRIAASAMYGNPGAAPYSIINGGQLRPDQLERLRIARSRLARLPIHVDQTSGLTMAQIEARASRVARKMERAGSKLGLVVIDYLQLLGMTDRYRGNLVSEYGEAVLHAKNMSKRLGVAVLLLSQLNRGVESRDNKRPLMSDLRGSGNIEEHADAVGLLYRPAYYDKSDPRANEPEFALAAAARANDLEIGVEKNRLGETGKVTLFCDVGHCAMSDKSHFGGY